MSERPPPAHDADLDAVLADTDCNAAAPMAAPLDAATEMRFGQLVRAHQSRLYHFVLRNIGHPGDAEDIAQQAFVEAYRSMASFRGESELSTWLYGIAMNLVRNYLNRAPHRVRKYESDDVLEDMPDAGDGPERLTGRNQLMRALQTQIEQLPVELQQVFLLVAVDGMSYDEAAILFEIPVGTVRSRLHRARDTLKTRLGAFKDLLHD